MRSTTEISVEKLRKDFAGRVIGPDDAFYDDARTVVSGEFDRRPAAIVQVADADDVARLVRLAGDSGVELAVRGGGHSGAGHSTTDGGIVLDLRSMKGLDIDVEGRTAWAQTGLTAAEYTTAAGAHGLATGFGDTGSVGIGGITLGGGIGYLVRKYGLTIDDLLAADIVTADGELLRVDEENHPDLFWAIRGGGGNFGVATRFRYRLHDVPTVVGGMMMLPATVEVIAGFMAAAAAAPDELSTIANVMVAPPMPMVPEEFHGRLVLMGLLCYAGKAAAGERALAPFRAFGPLADMVQPITYPEIYPPEDESYRPTAVGRTMFIDAFDDAVARSILEHLERSDASVRVAQLRVLGGAMARVPNDATAFAHRSSKIMVNVAAFYDGAEDRPAREQWVDEFVRLLRQGDEGAYVNFLVDEGPEAVRRAYPGATWDRLRAIKNRYDPSNLFRLNQNIPPQSG
jgi:FAD/FMN-containing dehydrogenase